MLNRYDDVFLPKIDGVSGSGYEYVSKRLLEKGFICGYSLFLEAITVGSVTSCGFTRLIDIGHDRAPHLFQEPTKLLEVLTRFENTDERGSGEIIRDWKERPPLMRCSALCAMIKAGFVFDRLILDSFGQISFEEEHAITLKASTDDDLRAALGKSIRRVTGKYLKHKESITADGVFSSLIRSKALFSDSLPHSNDDYWKTTPGYPQPAEKYLRH